MSMLDQLDAYEPMREGYVYWDDDLSGDSYNSAATYDYAYMMANTQCPVHHASVCRCVDPRVNSHMPWPGERITVSVTVVPR
jgi:hypothetical protein